MARTVKNDILISAACLFRDFQGKTQWFLIKEPESDKWETAKSLVRKGESSVRAILRVMGEKGGITTKILEEAGRINGVGVASGKTLPQRTIYYLMLAKKMLGETIGFEDFLWLDYAQATRKLSTKREKNMLKNAKTELAAWRKRREKRRKLLGLKPKK